MAGRSWAGFTSVDTIDSTSVENVLQYGKIYKVLESVTLVADPGRSALSVASGATAVLYIAPDVTLTVTGGAAVANTPAGAGINVPVDSTLIVCGSGTLNAVGGKGADGADGKKGLNADININTGDVLVGSGGNGGAGGGGAGAGIGGCGGDGGRGGEAEDCGSRFANMYDFSRDGAPGGRGGNGHLGEPSGTVYFLGSVRVNVASGDPGVDGKTGAKGTPSDSSGSTWPGYYFAAGGGGGGGGGKGELAFAIGGGGAGGGGGGGGGGGPTTFDRYEWSTTADGRDGGCSDNPGESTQGPYGPLYNDGYVYAYYGGNGGSTASVGESGPLYRSASSVLNSTVGVIGASLRGLAETHEAISYSFVFDTCGAGAVDPVTVQLGTSLPDLRSIPVREGCVFDGFWTKPGGHGVCGYGSDGKSLVNPEDIGSCTLYAHWIENHSIVVTTEEDLSPDEAASRGVVSLRSALARLWGTVTDNADNQYVVTFAPEVKNLTIMYPLEIPAVGTGSPENAVFRVVIDGTSGRENRHAVILSGETTAAFKDFGGDEVIFRNLEFEEFGSTSSMAGGVITSYSETDFANGEIRFENCSMRDIYGSAIFIGGKGTSLFIERSSYYAEDDRAGSAFAPVISTSVESSYGRKLVIASSTLSVANCYAIRSSGMLDCIIAHSTFVGTMSGANLVSCDQGIAVNSIFAVPEQGDATRKLYGLTLYGSIATGGSGGDTVDPYTVYLVSKWGAYLGLPVAEPEIDGVTHCGYAAGPTPAHGVLYHDETWSHVVLDRTPDGLRMTLRGDVRSAYTPLLVSQGNTFCEDLDDLRAGAFWWRELASVGEKPSLVVTTGDDVLDLTDNKISLAEAVLYANADPSLVNPLTRDRTITFDKSVTKATCTEIPAVKTDLVVDGCTGRVSSVTVSVGPNVGFQLKTGSVAFRDLMITGMATPPECETLPLFVSAVPGSLELDNCTFEDVDRVIYRTTLPDAVRLRVSRCGFYTCRPSDASVPTFEVEDAAGTTGSAVFSDCTFYDSRTVRCSGGNSAIVNCTFVPWYASDTAVELRSGSVAANCIVCGAVQTDGTPVLRDVYCGSAGNGYSPDSQDVIMHETVSKFYNNEIWALAFRGVMHKCFFPTRGVLGSFVWHDAGWDNIAISADRTGSARTAVFGDATLADILRVEDEIGLPHPEDAVWPTPAGSMMRDTPPPSLVVETEGDDSRDLYDSPVNLRSAIAAQIAFPWLLNTNTLTRAITFAPDVRTVTLTDKIDISGRDVSVTIDGNSGRGDLPAVKITNGGAARKCAFIIGDSVQFELANLMFENFGCSSGDYGAVIENMSGSPRIRVVNCAFRNLVLPTYGAVLKIIGDRAKLLVEGCSFYAISSSGTDSRVVDFEPDSPGHEAQAVISRCTFANNQGTAFYSLNNQAYHNCVISCSTFYKNTDYAVFSHLTDIYSSLMLGNGKADLAVTDEGTNTTYDTWAYKLPSGHVKRVGATRGAIGVKCNKEPSTYLFLTPETNVLHGVEHCFYRPRMQSVSELGTSSPKAAGAFLAHNEDWTTVDVETKYSSLDASLTPVTVDFVEENIDPVRLPCAGAVFYGEEEIRDPIVTTGAPADAKDYKMSIEEAFVFARSNPDNNTVTFSDDIYDTNGVAVVGFHNLMTVSNSEVVVKAPEGKTTILAYVPKLRTDGYGADEVARTHAFYIQEGGKLTLEGLVISNAVGNIEAIEQRHYERATSGGAILCYGELNASDCVFTCCEAGPQSYLPEIRVPTGVGGAVCTVGSVSTAILERCTFEYCHAACGGAVASVDGGYMRASHGIFRGNVAWTTLLMQGFGGAAYREGEESVLDIADSPQFIDNMTRWDTNVWEDAVERLVDEDGHIVISIMTMIGPPPLPPEFMLTVDAPRTLYAESPDSAASFAARLSVKDREWFTASADGTKVDFSLNEKAAPAIDAATVGDAFTATVGNVKPELSYALGWSDTPDGEFAKPLQTRDWVRAADGTPLELVAPKGDGGTRFYRVLVK